MFNVDIELYILSNQLRKIGTQILVEVEKEPKLKQFAMFQVFQDNKLESAYYEQTQSLDR